MTYKCSGREFAAFHAGSWNIVRASSHLSLYGFVSPPTNSKIFSKFLFIEDLGRKDSILKFQHTYIY